MSQLAGPISLSDDVVPFFLEEEWYRISLLDGASVPETFFLKHLDPALCEFFLSIGKDIPSAESNVGPFQRYFKEARALPLS